MSFRSLLPASLGYFDTRIKMVAEGGAWHPDFASDQALEVVGLVRDGKLTEAGDRYYMARLVAHDDEATGVVLSALL